MSGNNGVLRLFDEIAEHDSGDDLWMLGLGDGGKTSHHDGPSYQRSPSPHRNVVPSPLCNIPRREDDRQTLPPSSSSPIFEYRAGASFDSATASSAHQSSARDLFAICNDLDFTDRATTSSALSSAESDGAETVPPILSPVNTPSDRVYHRNVAARSPCPVPNSRQNGVAQHTQQRLKPSAMTRSQDLRSQASCDYQPAPQSVIQASQLAGCLQLVNGQLVVQAQLQQVQTPNGLMTVAVLPSLNRLQVAQNGTTHLAVTPTPSSPQHQQTISMPSTAAIDKSKKPRSIMPRPLNGNSRKRPLMAPAHAKTAQVHSPSAPTASPQSAMIVRLSSENADIVNRLSGEISRLQGEQAALRLDHSEHIRQLEQQRALIFGEALRSQHSVQAPQLAPSPPPPPPPPVCRQPNQRIVSINGQSYLMFDGHPLALQSASASDSVSISSSSSQAYTSVRPPNESTPSTSNGPTGGSVVSERSSKRPVRPTRSSVTFSKSTEHSANSKSFDAQIAKRQLQMKTERTLRLRERFENLSQKATTVDTETPFLNVNNAIERLLPFHIYAEPELSADALRHFDDNYLRYSARLMCQKKMLEHRFRAALFREAMVRCTKIVCNIGTLLQTPFAQKAEESLLAYLHSRHEQELLDRDREFAQSDLEGFVAQSELCAQGRSERMKTDIPENETPLDRSVQSLLIVDDADVSAEADMPISDYEMSVEEQSGMKEELAGWPSRPSSPAADGGRRSLAGSPSPSPVRLKLKLESPIRKRKKKRRKRRRHSSSPERRSPSPAQLLDTAPVAAETNSLKLRFRLASNGAADLIRLEGFVDAPKVPKLKIRLGGAQGMTTSVASEPKLSASMSSSTPLNGLEQSDSESDSVHALTRTRASSNGLGSDAGIVQFSPESDAHDSDDDGARLRHLTNSLIERLNVETLLTDARTVPTLKTNGYAPIGGLELSGSEHSD